MRMDILKTLSNEAKENAVMEAIGIIGVDEVLNGNLYESMKEFECGLYEDGNICPVDELATLEELMDDFVRVSTDENAEAITNAIRNAKATLDIATRPTGSNQFKYLCEAMDAFRILFDELGNKVYVDEI